MYRASRSLGEVMCHHTIKILHLSSRYGGDQLNGKAFSLCLLVAPWLTVVAMVGLKHTG